MAEKFGTMAESLIAGKIDDVVNMTKELLDSGTEPQDILTQGLLPGMDVVGQRFKVAEMYIPEVLRSAKAMSGSMEILRPLLVEKDVKTAGKMVIGTVKGDLHDIGKNLVGMMYEGAGSRSSTWGSTWRTRSSSTPSRNTSPTSWACRPC